MSTKYIYNDDETSLLATEQASLRRFSRVLGTPEANEVLHELETHFEVHLPVFQGKMGQFDPLDAMRRDAYREVFLYCRHKIEQALHEQDTPLLHTNTINNQ
ncbi:MAG: hypothetical protein RRY13_00220 [Akkermansia sp.]